MANDPIHQFVQNIPDDHLDQIHQALNAIRSGQLGGKPFDTSEIDPQKLAQIWGPIHDRVTSRDQAAGQRQATASDPGVWEGYLKPHLKAMVTGPDTLIGGIRETLAQPKAERQADARAILDEMGRSGSGPEEATKKLYGDRPTPLLNIPAMETPGQAQRHPIVHGMAQGMSGLTEPKNLVWAVTGGQLARAPEAAAWATRIFTAQMAAGNVEEAGRLKTGIEKGYNTGDWTEAKESAGRLGVAIPFTILGAMGSMPTQAEKGFFKSSGAASPTPRPEPTPVAPQAATAIQEPTPRVTVAKPAWVQKGEASLKEADRAAEPLRQHIADTAKMRTGELPILDRGSDAFDQPAQRVEQIQDRLVEGAKGPKTPEQKETWAAERAALMIEKAAIAPKVEEQSSPIDDIKAAVTRTVVPDKNPNSPTKESRAADLAAGVDAHAKSGKIGPEDLATLADAATDRANRIDWHVKLQSARDRLDDLLKQQGVKREVAESYTEAEPSGEEGGEDRPGQKVYYDSQTGSSMRTVLRMLGGSELSWKRIVDPITGRVERNLRTNPISPDEAAQGQAYQDELTRRVGDHIRRGELPNAEELRHLDNLATGVETATGKRAVFAKKGGLDALDPSRAALNELAGRGSKSRLALPKAERWAELQRRSREAADILNSHADRLSGSTSPSQPTPEAVAPKAVAETPTTTEPIPTRNRSAEIDEELGNIRDAYQDAQAAEREGGMPVSKETVQSMMKRVAELRAEKKSLGEKGAIPLGNLVPQAVQRGVMSARDWFDNNREDVTTIPGKLQDAYDKMSAGLTRLRTQFTNTPTVLKGEQPWTSHDVNTGQFKLHMAQTDEAREQFDKGLTQLIPNKLRRIAVTNYLEAGGDEGVLAQRQASSPKRFQRGYELAQQLSPLEKAAADSIRQSYDSLAARASQAGILHSFLEDYVNHIYKQKPPAVGRALEYIRSGQGGTLKSNPTLAMQRIFDSFHEAESKGFVPEKDIATLHSTYIDSLERAIASREYVKNGTQIAAQDGRAVFAPSGNARVVSGPNDAILVKPHGGAGEDLSGYRQINHSSMRTWQWQTKGPDGTPVFMEGDLKVHPDHYSEVKALLESSKVRDYAIGRGTLKVAAGIKNLVFLGTGFHPALLTFHGAEFKVNAFGGLDKLDVNNSQIQQEAVSHGLVLHDYDAAYAMGKSFEETNLAKSVPGIGPLIDKYQHWVFHDLQPRLKVTSFRVRMEENLATYGNKLSREQIASKTAQEVNNAYGGQDWAKMGASKTVQDLLRIGFIAPDFGISRAKYIAQSLNPIAHFNQTKAVWARGALGMYAMTRIANLLLSDDKNPHWDPKDAFAVFHGGKRYTLRSEQQDLINAVQDPKGFLKARFGPVPKTAIEAVTGRNDAGFERTSAQQVQDFMQRSTQLTYQQYLNSPDSTWFESMASSMVGLHTRDIRTPAEDLAMSYRASATPRGPQGDEERERLKTLRSIRRMISMGDMDRVSDAIGEGIDSGVLARGDAKLLRQNLGRELLPQLISRLPAAEQFDVYRKASEDERAMIGKQVYQNFMREMKSQNVPQSVKDRNLKEAEELFQ